MSGCSCFQSFQCTLSFWGRTWKLVVTVTLAVSCSMTTWNVWSPAVRRCVVSTTSVGIDVELTSAVSDVRWCKSMEAEILQHTELELELAVFIVFISLRSSAVTQWRISSLQNLVVCLLCLAVKPPSGIQSVIRDGRLIVSWTEPPCHETDYIQSYIVRYCQHMTSGRFVCVLAVWDMLPLSSLSRFISMSTSTCLLKIMLVPWSSKVSQRWSFTDSIDEVRVCTTAQFHSIDVFVLFLSCT